MTIEAPNTTKKDAPSLVFERHSLFSWKMIRLEIPENASADTGSRGTAIKRH